jgi:hypothetical protein
MPTPKYHCHLPLEFRTPSLTLQQAGLPLLHIFVSTPSSSDHPSLLSLLKPIAEKYKRKLNFATIDATKYRFFAKALNLATDKFPAFVIEDTVSGDTVPFDQNEEITGQKIEGFVQKYFKLRGKGNVPVHTAVGFSFGMETLMDHCM